MLSDLLLFVAVGFAAQLVDGAIGMAYGLTSTDRSPEPRRTSCDS
jgi:uncharacterized membrane protein YfcA